MTTPTAGAFEPSIAPPERSKRKPIVFIALAVIAALLISGGAFAVLRVLGGGGDQPASALPGDSVAYVRLDIDPSLGQKLAAVRFLQGMDGEVRDLLESDDIRKTFFEEIAAEEEFLAAVDYDEDIAPWLGDRIGVGVVPTGDAEPLVAVALAVTDEGAAEEGLQTLISAGGTTAEEIGVGWFFHGDYVVLAERSQAGTVQELVEQRSLADNDAFRSDMDALGDPGVLSFWADGDAISEYADEFADGAADLAYGMDPYGPVGSLGSMLHGADAASASEELGRFAGAIRFGDDFIELHGVQSGVSMDGFDSDTPQLTLGLPDDTAVAIGLEHGDDLVAYAWEQFSTFMPDELAEAQAEAAQWGLTLPDDIQVIVGQSLTLSAGPGVASEDAWHDPTTLPIAYQVATDTERFDELTHLLIDGDPDISAAFAEATDNGVKTIGLNQAYVDEVSAGGNLGGTSLFQAAVPEADDADAIFYVNLNAFEHLYVDSVDSQWRSSVEAMGAIGISSQWTEDGGSFTLRLVADQD